MLVITKINSSESLSNYGIINDITNIRKKRNVIRLGNYNDNSLNERQYGIKFGIIITPIEFRNKIIHNKHTYKNSSEFGGFFNSIGSFFGSIGSGIGNVFSSIAKNPILLAAAGGVTAAGIGLETGIIPSPFATSAPVSGAASIGTATETGIDALAYETPGIVSTSLYNAAGEAISTMPLTGATGLANAVINPTELSAPISGLNPLGVVSNPLSINLPGTTDLLNQLSPNLSTISPSPLLTQPASNLVQTDESIATQAESAYPGIFQGANANYVPSPEEYPNYVPPPAENISTDIVNAQNAQLTNEVETTASGKTAQYPKDMVNDTTSSSYSQDVLKYGSQILSKFMGNGQQSAPQQSTQSSSPNTMTYIIGQTSNQAPNTTPDMYNNQGAYLPGSQSVGDTGSTPDSSISSTTGTATPTTLATVEAEIQKYLTPTNIKYGLIGLGAILLLSLISGSKESHETFKLVPVK